MKTASIPSIRVEPELRRQLDDVLREKETITDFVEDAVRRAVEFRRVQVEFYARGEAGWQEHLRTGRGRSVDEVFDDIRAKAEAKRQKLLRR